MSGSRPTVDHPVCIPPDDEPDPHPARGISPCDPRAITPGPVRSEAATRSHWEPAATTHVHAGQRTRNMVVRDRIELSTFRFSGRRGPASQPLAELSVADVHALRCSVVSARSTRVKVKPLRERSLRPRPGDRRYRGGAGHGDQGRPDRSSLSH